LTKKPRRSQRHIPLLARGSVRPPPTLPDAQAVLDMGFPLTPQETDVIRMAMAIHIASKQPKLTWTGWRHIAVAVAIGTDHAREAAGGRMDTPGYRSVMSEFLRKTGFTFLNKVDRAQAVRLLPRWDEIDAWRSSLTPSRQGALNNPREIWDAFLEHRKKLGDPEAKIIRRPGGARRRFPSLLEQLEAMAEALEAAEERAERAEQETNYFANLMTIIAQRANLSEDDIVRIRAEVRARITAQAQPDDDDEVEE
jgi:hypothetical protein